MKKREKVRKVGWGKKKRKEGGREGVREGRKERKLTFN